MSSHREAPEISKDPVADSTDLYAFVSHEQPDTVDDHRQLRPARRAPTGGPNFYEFGDDVLYEIKIDNDGDGKADVTYQFTFTTEVTNPDTFLYNTGPILSLTDKNWNRRQTYTVVRVDAKTGKNDDAGHGPPVPAVQHRAAVDAELPERSSTAAIHTLPGGGKVFAGQRAEGFYVDLGADLRPRRSCGRSSRLHTTFGLQNTGLGRDGRGRERHQGRQRALDRDRGAEDGRSRRGARRRPTPPPPHR